MSCNYGQIMPFHLSDIGEGIKEVTVKEWYVKTGDALVDIEIEDGTSSEDTKTDDKVEVQEKDAVDVQETTPNKKCKKALATPAVRRLASEHGLNITEIQGSGKEGRVLKEDVLSFLNNQASEEKILK